MFNSKKGKVYIWYAIVLLLLVLMICLYKTYYANIKSTNSTFFASSSNSISNKGGYISDEYLENVFKHRSSYIQSKKISFKSNYLKLDLDIGAYVIPAKDAKKYQDIYDLNSKNNIVHKKIESYEQIVFTPSTPFKKIKMDIEQAKPNTVFIFKPGRYMADDTINIKADGVKILGLIDYKNKLPVTFVLTNPHRPQLFRITGDYADKRKFSQLPPILKQEDNHRVSTIYTDVDMGKIAYFEIAEQNTPDYIQSIKLDTKQDIDSTKAPVIRKFYGKFRKVYVDPQTNTIGYKFVLNSMGDKPALIPFTFSNKAKIRQMRPIKGVSIRNLQIIGEFKGYPSNIINNNLFVNLDSKNKNAPVAGNSHAVIFMDMSTESDIQYISIINAWSRGVEIKRSVGNMNVSKIYIDGAYNKGPGGNGYGLTLTGATDVTAYNLYIKNVRHALLFSSLYSENYNTIHILEANRDINFHGLIDYGNYVLVDDMALDYGDSPNATWTVVHYDRDPKHIWTPKNINRVVFGKVYDSDTAYDSIKNRKIDKVKNEVLRGTKVTAGDGNDVLIGDKRADILKGGSGNDKLYGGDGNDKIYGGDGYDRIYGGSGNDILYGEDDNDAIRGGDGNDKIYGGLGSDILGGGPGRDTINAGQGNDKIFGGGGNDILAGHEGQDILQGGGGADRMSGGSGSDIFMYYKMAESLASSPDIIMDFDSKEDYLDMTRIKIDDSNKARFIRVIHKKYNDKPYTILTNRKKTFAIYLKNVTLDIKDIKFKTID